MNRIQILAVLTVCLLSIHPHLQGQTVGDAVTIRDNGRCVNVWIDRHEFTRYDYTSFRKPIFYPVYGPQQIPMTRNFPMKKVDGEADDHPHHKSVWLGHEINGVDFWAEKGGEVKLQSMAVNQSSASFSAMHHWIESESGKIIVKDRVVARFSGRQHQRIIDYQIQFSAADQAVVFEDTKEGFFAVRVHPSLRHITDPKRGVHHVTGSMLNSNGDRGSGIWGKHAKWVCYHGQIEGRPCGIAVFDHPDNLRHPTTWHARDYGLLAANPFGISYFQNAQRGSGNHSLSPGKELNFKYRLLLIGGQPTPEMLDQSFADFSKW